MGRGVLVAVREPVHAAARGYVDDVIAPRDTAPPALDALTMLRTKKERLPARQSRELALELRGRAGTPRRAMPTRRRRRVSASVAARGPGGGGVGWGGGWGGWWGVRGGVGWVPWWVCRPPVGGGCGWLGGGCGLGGLFGWGWGVEVCGLGFGVLFVVFGVWVGGGFHAADRVGCRASRGGGGRRALSGGSPPPASHRGPSAASATAPSADRGRFRT